MPQSAQRNDATHSQPTDRLKADGPVNLLSEPGAITIEAGADGELAADGKPKLPRFTMVAYTGGPMQIAGWRHPVIIDLAGLAIPSQSRPIRFGHDMASGVGHTDSIQVQDGRLLAAGVVSRGTPAAQEIVVSARNGFPWQASIGAAVEEFEFVKQNQKATVNGREVSGPVNVIRKASLGEISFVDLGADGQTSANVAAVAPGVSQEKDSMDDENSVSTQGQETSNQETASQTPPVSAPAPASASTAAPPTPPAVPQATGPTAAEIRAQAVAETNRIARIRELCAGQFSDIEAQAIREGWEPDRCALQVLRASRPKAPAVHFRDNTVNAAVLQAACLMSAGLQNAEQEIDEATLEAADRRYRGSIGLQELLLEAAWANGYTGRNFRDARAVLRFAFRPDLQAGFSTIDIGGILSNVANKFLLEGFFSVERVWRNICAIRNVSDFKTVTSYRLIGKDQYEVVAPGGELKSGTLGNETYSNKADTYGLILSIDRRDIINDDLGAITTVPRKLGRGSGLKINDVFWATFLANTNFFKTANKNYLEGADTALSIDGLTKAEVNFMDQVDSDGKPVGVMPAILAALATRQWHPIQGLAGY